MAARATNDKHRQQLLRIMKSHGLSHVEISQILSKAVDEKLTDRTIFHWTADPSAKTSHHTPGWVIYVLRNELK